MFCCWFKKNVTETGQFESQLDMSMSSETVVGNLERLVVWFCAAVVASTRMFMHCCISETAPLVFIAS